MWKKQKPQSAKKYLQLESRIGKDSNMFVKFITAQEIFIFYKVEILSDQNMFLGVVYGLLVAVADVLIFRLKMSAVAKNPADICNLSNLAKLSEKIFPWLSTMS